MQFLFKTLRWTDGCGVQYQQWWDLFSLFLGCRQWHSQRGARGDPWYNCWQLLASLFIYCWSTMGIRWKLEKVQPASRFGSPTFWWPPRDFQGPPFEKILAAPLGRGEEIRSVWIRCSRLCDCVCVSHSSPAPSSLHRESNMVDYIWSSSAERKKKSTFRHDSDATFLSVRWPDDGYCVTIGCTLLFVMHCGILWVHYIGYSNSH